MLKTASRIASAYRRPDAANDGRTRPAPRLVVPDEMRDVGYVGGGPGGDDERQTGVSDGKVETPRRYVPFAARNESAGALPVSTASSKTAGVSPSTTTRISFLRSANSVAGQAAQAGVALALATAGPGAERGQPDGLEEADDGNQRERSEQERSEAHEDGRAATRSSAPERPDDQRRDGRSTEGSADPAGDCLVPAADRIADRRADPVRPATRATSARRGAARAEQRPPMPIPRPSESRSVPLHIEPGV